jgi:hypothetical protein
VERGRVEDDFWTAFDKPVTHARSIAYIKVAVAKRDDFVLTQRGLKIRAELSVGPE